MGEPLSVAASVVGIISIGLKSTEYLYKFYTTYRHQHSDLARIADQLSDLLESIQAINDIINSRLWRNDEQRIIQTIEKAITRSEDVIHTLCDEVNKFKKEPTSSWAKQAIVIGRRAAYPFKRSTMEDLSDDVDLFRNNLSIALQALQLKEHQITQDDIGELKRIVERAQAQNLSIILRRWLQAPDTAADYNNASNKRHAATGQWFTQSPAFANWLRRGNSLLWLYGFAGCGKSVLCSTAIQHAFRHQQVNNGDAVAFFFFTFHDDSKQDASAALRALILQLAGQIPGLEAELQHLQSTSNMGSPSALTLTMYLRSAMTRCRNVYILLDALDESPGETARSDVLSLIESIRSWALPGVHLMVTSRDTPDIRSCLEAQQGVGHTEWVSMKNDNIDQDIRDYVSYQVDYGRELQRWSSPQRQQIKDYLSKHASGVFRWVKCQLYPLRCCPRSAKHLESCLRSLPESLDKTYERMLCSIDEESKDDAQRILALLCFSKRPLSVGEVIEALAVDIDDLERYDEDRKLSDVEDLFRICPGLIEINPRLRIDVEYGRPWSLYDHEEVVSRTQVIRIGHFSVQEYLVSNRIKNGPASRFALSSSRENARICKTCVLYLSHDRLLEQRLSTVIAQEHALARYAAQSWAYHYQRADEDLAQLLSGKIISPLEDRLTRGRWMQLYNPEDSRIGMWGGKDIINPVSAMEYTAWLGLETIVAILFDRAADGNIESCSSAMEAASVQGHEKVVRTLLDRGADPNAGGERYGSPLAVASGNGYERIVKLLLDRGADVNAIGRDYLDTALYAASFYGREEIVKILLGRGANVNTKTGDYGSALAAACTSGHTKVVEILLDRGADTTFEGGHGTPLYVASDHGHEEIVKILLGRGANVNAGGGHFGSASAAAFVNDHGKVVEMLVHRGADVNVVVECSNYGTPLYAASSQGWKTIVKILLGKGADVNARGGQYGCALDAAFERNHEDIAEILMKHGATSDRYPSGFVGCKYDSFTDYEGDITMTTQESHWKQWDEKIQGRENLDVGPSIGT